MVSGGQMWDMEVSWRGLCKVVLGMLMFGCCSFPCPSRTVALTWTGIVCVCVCVCLPAQQLEKWTWENFCNAWAPTAGNLAWPCTGSGVVDAVESTCWCVGLTLPAPQWELLADMHAQTQKSKPDQLQQLQVARNRMLLVGTVWPAVMQKMHWKSYSPPYFVLDHGMWNSWVQWILGCGSSYTNWSPGETLGWGPSQAEFDWIRPWDPTFGF